MANSQKKDGQITRFDHRSSFNLSLQAEIGAVFVAAFSSAIEFQAIATFKNCEQHMSEIIRFIQESIKGSKSNSFELRIAGGAHSINLLLEALKSLGISVARKAVRDNFFEIRYRSEHSHLEISIDDISENSKAALASSAGAKKIKVLIVDDSASVTLLLKKVIETDANMKVIGTCALPSMVEEKIEALRPDVITMDIKMPEMDGPTLVKLIYPKYRIPIVMISSISREEGGQVLESLENGAVDYIQKPSLRPIAELAEIILPRLKAAAASKTSEHIKTKFSAPTKLSTHWNPNFVIAIGSSTGGVEALKRLLISFPPNIPPTVIAHHIPAVFSETLANRLNSCVEFSVSEARNGDILKPNHVFIAPGGQDLKIISRGSDLICQILEKDPNYHYHPSIDLLFDSVARQCGNRAIGILLTGMGRDGADGMVKLKNSGSWNIAQDESSSVVYGMPKAAFEMGGTHLVLHLDEIAKHIDQKIKL
jgi:two-component system chemotaxis response regulator CheB